MLLGVNTNWVGNFLKTSVFGTKVGSYRQFNDEYDITVRLPLSSRQDLQDLFNLHVPDIKGNPVPLSSLGTFQYTGGFGQINRVNQKRVVTLTADVAQGKQSSQVLSAVQRILTPKQVKQPGPAAQWFSRTILCAPPAPPLPRGLELPEGYTISYTGENRDMQEGMSFLFGAFLVGLLLIVLILVMEFNTLGVPLIIMTTVPLSLVGVGAGLLLTNTPFVLIMTGVGIISLGGVVVKNAIVMLDFTRKLQRRGLGVMEAAVEAGTIRLRPVLLTAATAVLGLVPMATGISYDFLNRHFVWRSESTEWWKSMANAVIYGLTFATLLTLVIVPVLYTLVYGLLEKWGLGGLRARRPS